MLAVARAKAAVEALERKGVRVLIAGSLAGGRFHEASDIDFLVLDCPRNLVYAIESEVEDQLQDLPFDVIYLSEIASAAHRQRLLGEAVDVRHLG